MAVVEEPQARNAFNWASIVGKWTFECSTATYIESQSGPYAYGLAVTDTQFRDGTAECRITFHGDALADRSGTIVLGYHSESSNYLHVGLGGWGHAYSMGEFQPGFGWRSVALAGSVENLQAERSYHLKVVQLGQQVTLFCDRVRVLDRVLTRPLAGNQLGLFAWGNGAITFDEVEIVPSRPRIFVAMQFSEPFDTLYKNVIQPIADEQSLDIVRIDEIAGPGIIFEDIKNEITKANIVIAEITAPNENVFYELGYAHALNKPTILLAQRGKQLPFDIRSYRVIFYDDTIGGKPRVEEQLRKHLRAILSDF